MNDYAIIPPAPGWLLVAHPVLDDPNFARTVVLVLAHDDAEGSMGVVLNRPGSAEGLESTVMEPWLSSSTEPATLFLGGPVQPDGYICLVADPAEPALVRSIDFMSEQPESGRSHRMYRGYAGWAPGQLSAEIAGGGWVVVPGTPEDPFTTEPESLWGAVLARQGGPTAALARVPVDPSMN